MLTHECRASLVAQMVKNLPTMLETWVRSWVGKIPWRRKRLSTEQLSLSLFHECKFKEVKVAQSCLFATPWIKFMGHTILDSPLFTLSH